MSCSSECTGGRCCEDDKPDRHCDMDCACRGEVGQQVMKLVAQADRLVGDLVLLHAESGAPAPPDFQVAAKRIRTLRLLHETLLREFPEIDTFDNPRTRLSGEVQVLLKQLES